MKEAPSPLLRLAVPGDARAISEVQIEVRRSTYRGLVPDSYLDGLASGLDDRARSWTQRLETLGTWHTLVAEGPSGGIVGFCLFGPEPHARLPFTSVIDIIYLRKEYQRRGVGELMFREAARRLARDGHQSVHLWVHARNLPARQFYEKLGGHPIDNRAYDYHGAAREDFAYGWDEAAFRKLVRP